MATMPRGATLIDNPISIAPGFTIGNVHVMAGIPRVMQAMFATLAPSLAGGTPVTSRAVHVYGLAEGRLADKLGEIQTRFPSLDIGSYPFYRMDGNGVALVAKGTDPGQADEAAVAIADMIRGFGKQPIDGEPPV